MAGLGDWTQQPRFIAFEGGEGSGKSTQARMLATALENAGCDVLLTREPGGTPGAEAIRNLLLDPPGDGWNARSEALLFAAARSDHVERAIRPALDRGAWIVCDRFVGSSLAYQGVAGGLGIDDILSLHQFGSGGAMPDLTFLIGVSERTSNQRRAERGGSGDAIENREAAFHTLVRDGFVSLAETFGEGWVIIDGEGSADHLHSEIIRELQTR